MSSNHTNNGTMELFSPRAMAENRELAFNVIKLPVELQHRIFDQLIVSQSQNNRIIDLAGPKDTDPQQWDTFGALASAHPQLQASIEYWMEIQYHLERIGPRREICDPTTIKFSLDMRHWNDLPWDFSKWPQHLKLRAQVKAEGDQLHLVWQAPDVLDNCRHVQIRFRGTQNGKAGRGFGAVQRVLRILPKLPNLGTLEFLHDGSDPDSGPLLSQRPEEDTGSPSSNYTIQELWEDIWESQEYCHRKRPCVCCPVAPQVIWGTIGAGRVEIDFLGDSPRVWIPGFFSHRESPVFTRKQRQAWWDRMEEVEMRWMRIEKEEEFRQRIVKGARAQYEKDRRLIEAKGIQTDDRSRFIWPRMN
ncbi:uncharacterized protein LY89DRAFT_740087 [Mollisia scopiformis]|uniref:Uncharacterized protein n=1 Tax=Mollisia scopiformis TaxID=149040 RepID=A0A132BDB0_MOLSC|nr:uncharacterized protein LY89DRAFT_740087 [Mollisia scopiformis]KUJ10361.1 hypothetical protein LY89DRAFT_740087 [Mollisia scopiformis]